MNSINEINEYLQSKEIMFSIFQSSKNVSSLAESAKSRGQKIDQVLRSLLFHLPKKRFIMVVIIAGNYRVNWKLLRNFIGENRISLATPEEVIYETNYQLGVVCPFFLNIIYLSL
ncbi:MAG: hypothetical protein CVU39_02600 [Chloroflexi bacterium HGW-Chloroflexi-10]|nr:MAG: hypothetical protein CVU39_02600 [Chloroflexi bacterium HGW-Chloroflexi-10]